MFDVPRLLAQFQTEDPMKFFAATVSWIIAAILLPVLALVDASRLAKTVGIDFDLISWYCRQFIDALSRLML